ncbi:MAG: hypothetical protein VKJ06_08525 [Vampirovibrionales bacterium]|nr:hypothetical protein [Vampirovibrionales bacterium]
MRPGYILLALCPNALKIWVYNTFLGAKIHRTAKLGLSYLQARQIIIGAHARLGHFNLIKNLDAFELGAHAQIDHFNTIKGASGQHFQQEPGRVSAFRLGDYSSVGKRHYLDCSNTISIGHHSAIAGFNSSIYTHGINFEQNQQQSAMTRIGDYCRVATSCVIVKGSQLPDCSILAANSTLHKAYDATHTLYSGVPAKPIKQYSAEAAYFHRQEGWTH